MTRKTPATARVIPTPRCRLIGSRRKIAARTKTKMFEVWFSAAAMEAGANFMPANHRIIDRYAPRNEPESVNFQLRDFRSEFTTARLPG